MINAAVCENTLPAFVWGCLPERSARPVLVGQRVRVLSRSPSLSSAAPSPTRVTGPAQLFRIIISEMNPSF